MNRRNLWILNLILCWAFFFPKTAMAVHWFQYYCLFNSFIKLYRFVLTVMFMFWGWWRIGFVEVKDVSIEAVRRSHILRGWTSLTFCLLTIKLPGRPKWMVTRNGNCSSVHLHETFMWIWGKQSWITFLCTHTPSSKSGSCQFICNEILKAFEGNWSAGIKQLHCKCNFVPRRKERYLILFAYRNWISARYSAGRTTSWDNRKSRVCFI